MRRLLSDVGNNNNNDRLFNRSYHQTRLLTQAIYTTQPRKSYSILWYKATSGSFDNSFIHFRNVDAVCTYLEYLKHKKGKT